MEGIRKGDKCPVCNNEMFQVYFGNDGRYQGIKFERCMVCGQITIKKDKKDKVKVTNA